MYNVQTLANPSQQRVSPGVFCVDQPKGYHRRQGLIDVVITLLYNLTNPAFTNSQDNTVARLKTSAEMGLA